MNELAKAPESAGCILVVDDRADVRRTCERVLRSARYAVRQAENGDSALAEFIANEDSVDCIVSDVCMPGGMDGLALVRQLRARGSRVPVILMTGSATIDDAMSALEGGATRYVRKPFAREHMLAQVAESVAAHRRERLRREEQKQLVARVGDLVTLERRFDAALASQWMAFQPIVDGRHRVYGYEALLRTREPSLSNPSLFIEAAEHLGRADRILAVASRSAGAMASAAEGTVLFVNIRFLDLLDPLLFDPASALVSIAPRVVLELTERESWHRVPDVMERIARLGGLGFRVCVDDLGAGYSTLASLVELEPHVVKLDMSLVRGIDGSSTRRRIVEALCAVCRDAGRLIVAEGVETEAEMSVLVGIGVDLFQGFLFGRPGPAFPIVTV